MVEIAVGLGIFISLILTETLGVTAGGVIVPGYIALYLHDPMRVVGTILISLLVYFLIRLMSRYVLIYGKRRLVLSLLLGFLFGYLSRIFMYFPEQDLNLAGIGNIIPGLIASWMDRQGVVRTLSVIMVIAVVVQLVLMLFGMEVPPNV